MTIKERIVKCWNPDLYAEFIWELIIVERKCHHQIGFILGQNHKIIFTLFCTVWNVVFVSDIIEKHFFFYFKLLRGESFWAILTPSEYRLFEQTYTLGEDRVRPLNNLPSHQIITISEFPLPYLYRLYYNTVVKLFGRMLQCIKLQIRFHE